MTDISHLVNTVAPLPMRWYFDPDVLAAERSALFDAGPGYVGHELMVPESGAYHVLDWMANARMLVRNGAGVELMSNVCRHRQGLLLQGRGHARNIVCPLHRWTYNTEGALLGAPEFAASPCLSLPKTPLTSWKGLLFAGARDVAADLRGFGAAADYDFSGYVYDHTEVDECPFNWKTFLEIYLELYHVEPFHPGLRDFVDAGNFRWEFGERWSIQYMGVKEQLQKTGSAKYARYRDALLRYTGGDMPKYGTIWSIYYPNVMLEWYPACLVVSTLIPRSPDYTTNVVEFYYPEDVAYFETELKEAHQAAYLESAQEDAEICALLHRGRRALWLSGGEDRGPYQTPLEDGMIHFHDFVRRALEGRIDG